MKRREYEKEHIYIYIYIVCVCVCVCVHEYLNHFAEHQKLIQHCK